MKKTKSNKSFFKKELGHFKHIWSMMAANMEEKSKELGVPEEDIRLIEKRNSAIKNILFYVVFISSFIFVIDFNILRYLCQDGRKSYLVV